MKIKLLSVIYLSLLCWNLSLARERNLAPNELGLNAITKTSSDVKVSKKQKDNVMSIINNVNRYWQSHHSPEVRSFWDDAAYHTGNIEVFKLTGNNKQLDYSRRWANYNHWKGATEPDTSKWLYKQYGEDMQHVLFGDWQTCFQTYLDLYMLDKANGKADVDYMVARTREVMDYMVRSAATDYWYWSDALYMVMPVMYKMTGDEKYLDKLYANLLYSDSIMLDKETGLYYRDAKYVYPAHKTINGKKDFWARGDGWVLAGLAKVLQDMPTTYKHYGFFKNKFLRLAKSVALIQQPEGYWCRSMMDEQQAPGYETSGTAFFTYGLLWGVNNGILSKTEMQPVIDRAWIYLTTKALQPSGKVGYVQPIGERALPDQVVNADSEANFGVGAFLLAACEYYRFL